jgi:quercetin dioxygenase-like cupin family protein
MALVAVGLPIAAAAVLAQAGSQEPAMQEVAAASLTWNDIEVPGFKPGMQIATVYGDPSVADKPYTLRLALPAGYAFPPHFHPRAENVTVLEGTFQLAMGRKFDESMLKTYHPGDYLYIAPENAHFGKVQERTVLQLHGTGPFEITVVKGQEMTE